MTQHSNFSAVRPLAADALARLDQLVTDFVDRLGNLGALVAIDVDGIGRMTFTAGHSNLEKSRVVQPGMLPDREPEQDDHRDDRRADGARRASDLDDPVARHLDLPIDRRITVRHLLMNSSGLGEYVTPLFSARNDPRINLAPRDLLALALPQGQIFEPGERFDYTNTGWVIAAMLIETICGKSYGDVATERIVKPLGLKASGFGGHVPPGERMHCYMNVPMAPAPVDTSGYLSWAFGAGDGLATADDILAIYASLMRDDSPLGISLQELAAETLKPSASPYSPMSMGAEYGLGLERRAWAGSEVWGHPGSTGGCRSSTWIDVARGVSVATAATVHMGGSATPDAVRYPREQLFSMALNTAYALAAERG